MNLIINFTEHIRQLDWNNSRQITLQQNPSQGLYLLAFQNKRSVAIHDRNKNKKLPSDQDSGKLIIPGNATTLKFGKFETNLKTRLLGYHKHLHYFDDYEKKIHSNVFTDCLDRFYFFPLPNTDSKQKILGANVFEEFWNSAINAYLSNEDLLSQDQNLRSEYRTLNTINPQIYEGIEDVLSRVSETILQISALIKARHLS